MNSLSDSPSTPGALVHARGREWVVLPESTADLLMLRPVGGLDNEEAFRSLLHLLDDEGG